MGDGAGIEDAADGGVGPARLLSNTAEVASVTRPARPRLATWTEATDGVPTRAGVAAPGEVGNEVGAKAGVVALEIAGAARPPSSRAARPVSTGAARRARMGTAGAPAISLVVLAGTGVEARATIGTIVLATIGTVVLTMAGDARPGTRGPTAVGIASRFLLAGAQGRASPEPGHATPVGRASGPVDMGGSGR